jgi:lipoate-protein ligase B
LREPARRTISEDVLLLVEHPPVVTLGRSSKGQHLLASPELLEAEASHCSRSSGVATSRFTGGQLVATRSSTSSDTSATCTGIPAGRGGLLAGLEEIGIPAERSAGYGVWTRGRKIASIGVHARDRSPGFAQRDDGSRHFDLMVPCGIQAVTMTSVRAEPERDTLFDTVSDVVARVRSRI